MTVVEFFTGTLIVNSLLLLWFGSPLKITLGQLFFKKTFITNNEFDDFLFMKSPFIGKLTSCWICLSFWLSLLVGIAFVGVIDAPIITPLLTFLIYPSLCYVFKIIAKL